MASRSEALAQKVEQANDALRATIEQTTDEQWRAKCADGEWTQGFAGFHAATSIGNITGMVKAIASGEPFQAITFDQIDAMNAEFHDANRNCTKAQALELVRTNSPVARQMVANLTDAELERTATLAVGMPAISVEQVVEMLLIGHPANHRESMIKAQ